jgi:NAD(P)-dependent dehydrogenase (short-subunit alcohol dehydrogenase family)
VAIMDAERTVVVSGGGTGIGSAVARRLASGGRPVTIVGRRRDRLDQVAAPFAPLAMKAALHAWAFDLARELGTRQGTANVIAPGFVPDTGFWAGRLNDELVAQRSGQTLVGRPGTPEEVASFIDWLLSADGGWVTGQVLSPNGGSVLGR